MEQILKTKSVKGRAYPWEPLGFEVGLRCSGHKVKRTMGIMNYHKYVACRKMWVNKKTAKVCINWATVMLERYSHKENWYRIQFNDKVHFSYCSEDQLKIIQKTVIRYC